MPDWRAEFADELYDGFELRQVLTRPSALDDEGNPTSFEAVVRRQYGLMDRNNVNIQYIELHVHPKHDLGIKEELVIDDLTYVVETIDPMFYSNRVVLSRRAA